MKKGLFLLLAIITLGLVNAKADVAPPVMKERYVEVVVNGYKDDADLLRRLNNINNIDGVSSIYFDKHFDETVKLYVTVVNDTAIEEIKKDDGFVLDAKYIDKYPERVKECPQSTQNIDCTTSEGVSEDDIKNLKMATIIVYITLSVLVVLMIIITGLMIHRRKKDSKKDA